MTKGTDELFTSCLEEENKSIPKIEFCQRPLNLSCYNDSLALCLSLSVVTLLASRFKFGSNGICIVNSATVVMLGAAEPVFCL